jgi:alanine racemase
MTPVPPTAPGVLHIDLDALRANWRLLAAQAGGAEVAGVVKADAYGLGAGPVAAALWAEGCRRFFVATVDEAVRLRATLPAADIAMLGGLMPGTEADLIAASIAPVLNSLEEIGRWRAAARARGLRLPALIHIDTGMNRLGLERAEVDALAADPAAHLDGLTLRLWMTHLACADEYDHPMTAAQATDFAAVLARLPVAAVSAANSSGLFRAIPVAQRLARPGAALYGINPTPEAPNPMRAVVRLSVRVLQVRRVDSPMTVGYGAAHLVRRPGRIATLAAGYADGYPRSLGGRGRIAADGRTAPIVGRISMDLLTADVTDWPDGTPAPGDLIDLIGPHRDVDAVAAEAGTIGYEVLATLGHRWHRVWSGVVAVPDGPVLDGSGVPLEAAWAL